MCGEPGLGGRSDSRERREVGTGPGRVVAAPEKWRDVMWGEVEVCEVAPRLAVWDSWPWVRGAVSKESLV